MRTSLSSIERYDLRDLGLRDSAEGWRAVCERAYIPFETQPEVEAGREFEARIVRASLGDLAVVDVLCGRGSGRRGPSQISATNGDILGFIVLRRGSVGLSLDGHSLLLSAGQSVLWDGARVGSFNALTSIEKRTLIVPRSRLQAVFPRYERALGQGISAATASVRLLAAYLDALVEVQSELDVPGSRAAADVALELLRTALARTVPAESAGLHVALVASARRYVDQHLGDSALGPVAIARAHAVSVRTLHAAFEATGETVSSLIRRRRLERSRADLEFGAETIATVALRWGFTSPSHFSRLFRTHFGASPREIQALARERLET